jgi:hypothetical protein
MQTIEFKTPIKDGIVHIPYEYLPVVNNQEVIISIKECHSANNKQAIINSFSQKMDTAIQESFANDIDKV